MRRCTTTKNIKTPHDPTKLAIDSIVRPEADLISNCGHIFKNSVSFDDNVQFKDE